MKKMSNSNKIPSPGEPSAGGGSDQMPFSIPEELTILKIDPQNPNVHLKKPSSDMNSVDIFHMNPSVNVSVSSSETTTITTTSGNTGENHFGDNNIEYTDEVELEMEIDDDYEDDDDGNHPMPMSMMFETELIEGDEAVKANKNTTTTSNISSTSASSSSSINYFPHNSNQYQLTEETTVTKISDPIMSMSMTHQSSTMTFKTIKSPPPLLPLNLSPLPSTSSSSYDTSLVPPTLTLVQHHHPSPDSNLSITTVSPSPPLLQPQYHITTTSATPTRTTGTTGVTPFKRQNGPGRPRRKTEHKIIRTEFMSSTTSSSNTQQLNILLSSNSNQNQNQPLNTTTPLSPYVYRTRTSLRNSIAMQNKKLQAAAAAEKAANEKKEKQQKQQQQQQQRQNIKPNIVTTTSATTTTIPPRKPGIRLPGRPPLSLNNRPPTCKINSPVSKEKEKFIKKVLSSTFPQRPRPPKSTTTTGTTGTVRFSSNSSSCSSVASSTTSAASSDKAGPGRPRKRLNRKLSAAEQLEQTKKDGCIDLETPSSFLANVNLRAILNKHTFSMLPPIYQYKLIQLLPEPDNSSIKLSSSALNNEFFAKACSEWSTKLLAGEFESEQKMSKKEEAKREKLKLDPWKLKHFEPIWGQKSINKPLNINMDCLTSSSMTSSATSASNTNNNKKDNNNKQNKQINNLPKMYNPDMRRISSRCSLRLSPKIEPTPTTTSITSNAIMSTTTTSTTNKRKSGELLEDSGSSIKDNQVVKKLKVLTPVRVQKQQNPDIIPSLEKVDDKEKVSQVTKENSQITITSACGLEISQDQDCDIQFVASIEKNKTTICKNLETGNLEKKESANTEIETKDISQKVVEECHQSPAIPLPSMSIIDSSSKPICDANAEPENSGELLIITLPSKPVLPLPTSAEKQQQPNKKVEEIKSCEISKPDKDISNISSFSSDITIKRTNIIEDKTLQQQQQSTITTTIEKSDENNVITIMEAKSPPPEAIARSAAAVQTPKPTDDKNIVDVVNVKSIKIEEPSTTSKQQQSSIIAEDENKIPPEIKRIIPSTVTVVARTISPQLQQTPSASTSSSLATTTTSKSNLITTTSTVTNSSSSNLTKPTQTQAKPQSVVLKIIPNQIVTTQENQIIIPGSSKTIINKADLCPTISSVKPKLEKVETTTTTTTNNDDIKIIQHNVNMVKTENLKQQQQLTQQKQQQQLKSIPINKPTTNPLNVQSSNLPMVVEKKPKVENPIISQQSQLQTVNKPLPLTTNGTIATTTTTSSSSLSSTSVSSPSSSASKVPGTVQNNNLNPMTISTTSTTGSKPCNRGGGKSKQNLMPNKKGGPGSNNSTPPGQVNLERSYAICQAVIQNSPNRDQLQNQLLKPPPIPKTQTMTISTSSFVHSNHGSPVQQQQQQQGETAFSNLNGALRGGSSTGTAGSHRVSPGPALIIGDGRTTTNYIHSQLPSSIQLTTTAALSQQQQQQQSKVIVMPSTSNVLPISTKPIVRPLSAPSTQQQSQILGHQYAAAGSTKTTANNASSQPPSSTYSNNNTTTTTTTTLNITPQQLAILLQQQDKLTTANLPQFLNLVGKNATVSNISANSRTRTPSPLTTTINQQQQQITPDSIPNNTNTPTTTTIKILNSAQMQRIIMQGQQQPQQQSGNDRPVYPVKAQILTSNGETLTIHRASFPSSPGTSTNTNNNNVNVITTMRPQQQIQPGGIRVRAPFTQLVSMGQVRSMGPQQSYIVSTSNQQQQQSNSNNQQQSNQAIGGFRIIQSSSDPLQGGGHIGPLSNLADFITNQIANSNIRPISPLNSGLVKTTTGEIDPNRINTSSPSSYHLRKLNHPGQIFVEDLINSSSTSTTSLTDRQQQQQQQQSMIFTSSSGNMTIRPSTTPNILVSSNSQIQNQSQRKQQQHQQFGITSNPNNFTFTTNSNTSSASSNTTNSSSSFIISANNNNNNTSSKISSASSSMVSLDRNTIIIQQQQQQDNKEKGKQQQQFIIVHTTSANGVPTSFAVPASILQQSQQQQQPGTSGQQQQQKLIPPRASSAPPNQQQNILTTTTGSPQFVTAATATAGTGSSSSTIYLNGSNLETTTRPNNNVQDNIRLLVNTQFPQSSQQQQQQQQQLGQNKLYFSAPQQQQQQVRSRVFTQPQQNNIIRLHVNQPGSYIQQQQSVNNNIRQQQQKVPPLVGQGPGGQLQVMNNNLQNPSSVMTSIKCPPNIAIETAPGQFPVISIPEEGSQQQLQQQQQHGGNSSASNGGNYMNGGDFDIFKVINNGPSSKVVDGGGGQGQQQNILVEDLGGLGGGVVVDGSGNCICDLRAYIMCRKCGVFCHDDCMQQNSNLCMTCMI